MLLPPPFTGLRRVDGVGTNDDGASVDGMLFTGMKGRCVSCTCVLTEKRLVAFQVTPLRTVVSELRRYEMHRQPAMPTAQGLCAHIPIVSYEIPGCCY